MRRKNEVSPEVIVSGLEKFGGGSIVIGAIPGYPCAWKAISFVRNSIRRARITLIIH
jgi:hypothetical protein